MQQELHEYHEHWQRDSMWWEGMDVTIESCILFETGDSPMAEGAYILPDFGHVICFYRYFRAPEKPQPQTDFADVYALVPGLELAHKLYGNHQPQITDEEFDASWGATVHALDALLGEFVEQGYQAGMKERLRAIVSDSLSEFQPYKIFVLPNELELVTSSFGNSTLHVDYGAYESEEEAEEKTGPFDLHNPAHCAALTNWIWNEYGR